MVRRTKFRSVIPVVCSSLVSLLVMACGPSVVTQSEPDKAKSQLTASEAPKKPSEEPRVGLILGVKKEAPPPPPASAPRPPQTTPASYYEPVGPSSSMWKL
jgi:hypothetical protein